MPLSSDLTRAHRTLGIWLNQPPELPLCSTACLGLTLRSHAKGLAELPQLLSKLAFQSTGAAVGDLGASPLPTCQCKRLHISEQGFGGVLSCNSASLVSRGSCFGRQLANNSQQTSQKGIWKLLPAVFEITATTGAVLGTFLFNTWAGPPRSSRPLAC